LSFSGPTERRPLRRRGPRTSEEAPMKITRIRSFAAALGALAFAGTATLALAGDDQGKAISAGKLAKDAKDYYGQTVAVQAEVEDVLSANAFTLDEDSLFAGPDVLVLVPKGVANQLSHDQKVTVRGKVRRYVVADLDKELDWFDNGKIVSTKTDVDWKTRPVVVAEALITSDGRDLLQAPSAMN
jgi:hypothetical protein